MDLTPANNRRYWTAGNKVLDNLATHVLIPMYPRLAIVNEHTSPDQPNPARHLVFPNGAKCLIACDSLSRYRVIMSMDEPCALALATPCGCQAAFLALRDSPPGTDQVRHDILPMPASALGFRVTYILDGETGVKSMVFREASHEYLVYFLDAFLHASGAFYDRWLHAARHPPQAQSTPPQGRTRRLRRSKNWLDARHDALMQE